MYEHINNNVFSNSHRLLKLIKKNVLVITILLIVIINTTVVQADNSFNFRNIYNEDGLSQGTVETMIQDKQGYIWIGTNDGLNKYNGYEFEVFRHEDGKKNTIVNNYIVDLVQDKEGYIWVGTGHGLSRINPKDDSIRNYTPNDNKGRLSNYNIGDLLVTKSGDILVGTSDGLNLYDKESDSFKRILSAKNELSSQIIYSLEEDSNGNVWVGTKEGLNKIIIKDNKIKHFKNSNENSVNLYHIYDISSDDNGYIWAGTFGQGVLRININTDKVESFKHDPKNKKSLAGNYVRNTFKDSNNNLWIATNRGLSKFDEKNQEFDSYCNKPSDRNSLVEDEVYCIIEDSGGLIWVGTYSGISVFDPKNKIEHYRKDPLNSNSLNGNLVHGIYEDDEGFIWVGTNSKGVNIIDRKKDTVKHMNEYNTAYKLSSDSVNDISGKGDDIFIATNNGLNRINKKDNTIKVYKKEDGLPDNYVSTLFMDDKGNLWVGTVDGIAILNLENNTFKNFNKDLRKKGIKDLYTRVIYQDSDGVYWAGFFIDGGLVKIDPKTNEVENYRSNPSDITTISDNVIRYIADDERGNLWVGTSDGLNKFNKKTEKFTRYTTKQGLPNNIIYGVLLDNDGNPWVSTNSGIAKFDVIKNTFEHFGIIDGFQGREFNGGACQKTKNGDFCFGGVNGLNIFNPKNIHTTNYSPKVIFDKFEINGKKYSDIDGQVFKSNENYINIQVFIPDLKNIQSTQYYYKLEGTDTSWNIISDNKINYSNLSPGDYKFRIKARNHNGAIGKESTVSFTIKPPIWKSKIAYLIYLLIIVIIVVANIKDKQRLDILVKKKTEQLTKEKEKSEQLLNKVIQLERNKNRYLINLSHELRTPLNVIYTTEQLITELNKSEDGIDRNKVTQYMKVIKRNATRLLNLINNLIDGTKIETGSYKLKISENDIVYIVEEATLSLKEYIESKGIDLIIDPDIEEKMIKCDPHEIERCIVNLVSNAAKFTPSGGKIEVIIEDLGDKVKIVVRDNGIGIEKKYQDAIFDRFNQVIDANSEVKGGSGLGLTITKNIIELHKGTITLESEVGKGCTFTIIL